MRSSPDGRPPWSHRSSNSVELRSAALGGRLPTPSLLARTRSAVRERFRGTVGSDAPSHLDELADLTVGAFLNSWLTDVARVTVRPRTCASHASPSMT